MVCGVLAHIKVFLRFGETHEVMELVRSQYPKHCLNQGGRQFSDRMVRGSNKGGAH